MPGVRIIGPIDGTIEFLAIGHLTVDVRHGERVLGGAAAYSALTAMHLGLRTGIVTAVGSNFDLFEALAGIEIHLSSEDDRDGRTTSFENRYLNGRREQRILGRASVLRETDVLPVESRLAPDAIVFYCPLARELDLKLVRRVPRGLAGVAPQGFFRRWDDEGRVHQSDWPEAGEALLGVDFVSLSEHDVPDVEAFVSVARSRATVVAVTEGVAGARVFHAGGVDRVRAWVREEVDPTGAGDVFAAALLVALREGHAPRPAAEFACSSASFAVERHGVDGVPTDRAAVEARLAEYRREP